MGAERFPRRKCREFELSGVQTGAERFRKRKSINAMKSGESGEGADLVKSMPGGGEASFALCDGPARANGDLPNT